MPSHAESLLLPSIPSTQETTHSRHIVTQEIERMVRQAHQRVALSASLELLPALPGMENRLYALFAD